MSFAARSQWLVPGGLVALSVAPVLAGAIRLVHLTAGAQITPDDARFSTVPLPVVLHVLSATMFCVVGALQFAPGLRRGNPSWHRISGRGLIPCGLVAALSGLWMTQFYPTGVNPPASFDGPFLYALRLVAGSGMIVFLCLGLAAILRRDIARHRVWMMRGFALGLGAGTQVFTHLPWFLLPSIQGELARTVFMGAGWAINLVVVEWFISRESPAGGFLKNSSRA
jgi:uncharacterized membrane protein